MGLCAYVAWLAVMAGVGVLAQAPAPWRGENLQYFPKDIPRPQLIQRMREFSFALGVRCQHCHAGGDGVSFDGVVFASDDKPAKLKARAMLRMVDQLNHTTLAQLPSRAAVSAAPAAQTDVLSRMDAWSKALGVECAHCHVAGQWADASKPTFDFARRMSRMLDALNAGPMKDLGGISCRTCHRGRPVPARVPPEAWETIRADHAAEFAAAPNRAITMSVYAASLGVDCSHCHEADRALNTKAPKAMVARMLPVFDEIPKHFDKAVRMPRTQCYMCHQGNVTPER